MTQQDKVSDDAPQTKVADAAEKKAAVMRDVMRRIEAGSYRLKMKNGYVQLVEGVPEPFANTQVGDFTDVRDHVDTLSRSCEVCMLGATFLSFAAVYDNVPLSSILTVDGDVCAGRDVVTAPLEAVFDEDELGEMEDAFELWANEPPVTPGRRPAALFGKAAAFAYMHGRVEFESPAHCVAWAVAENVARNGTFDPAQDPDFSLLIKKETP